MDSLSNPVHYGWNDFFCSCFYYINCSVNVDCDLWCSVSIIWAAMFHYHGVIVTENTLDTRRTYLVPSNPLHLFVICTNPVTRIGEIFFFFVPTFTRSPPLPHPLSPSQRQGSAGFDKMGSLKKFACLFCDFVSGNSSNVNSHLNHFVNEIAESRGIIYEFDEYHPRGIIREARYLTQHLWEKKNKPAKWNFNKDPNIRALQQGFKSGLVQELAHGEKVLDLLSPPCFLFLLTEMDRVLMNT